MSSRATSSKKRPTATEFLEYTLDDVPGDAPSFTAQELSTDGWRTHSKTVEVHLPSPMKREQCAKPAPPPLADFPEEFEYVFDDLCRDDTDTGPTKPTHGVKPRATRYLSICTHFSLYHPRWGCWTLTGPSCRTRR